MVTILFWPWAGLIFFVCPNDDVIVTAAPSTSPTKAAEGGIVYFLATSAIVPPEKKFYLLTVCSKIKGSAKILRACYHSLKDI